MKANKETAINEFGNLIVYGDISHYQVVVSDETLIERYKAFERFKATVRNKFNNFDRTDFYRFINCFNYINQI